MSTGALAPGTVVGGRYTLVRRLGAGGFGAVWLAQDAQSRGIDRPVAVKILHPELHAVRGRDYARFVREAEILGRLDHPSISRALDYDLAGEHAYIVMEHVDGLPLDRVLVSAARRGGPVDPGDAARIFDEMSSAVAYAHDLGIVHRDLKPKNVMVVRRAERVFVKVLDFGIARVAGESSDGSTTVGRVIGSYYYMAPEQVRGEHPDARADVFAMGAMLFELITGHRAWARDPTGGPLPAHQPVGKAPPNTLGDITMRLLTGERPRPSDLVEGLPLALDDVVARALAIEPADRYPSVVALAAAARPHLAERKSLTGHTIVALESDVREALLRDVGTPRSSEEVERVVAPVEPPPLPTRLMPDATASSAAWASRSLGGAGDGPPPRHRGALFAGATLALLSASIVFAVTALRRRDEAPTELHATPIVTRTSTLVPGAVAASAAESTPAAGLVEAPASDAPRPSAASPPATARPTARPTAAPPTAAPPTAAPPTAAPPAAAPPTAAPPTAAPPDATPPGADATRARLTRLLTEARASGGDLRALTALGEAIRAEALTRPEPVRNRALRLVETSLGVADVDGLAAAIDTLYREGHR